MATAADSMGDVITTGATIASVIIFYFTGINIDGYVGLGVSLVVMCRYRNRKRYAGAIDRGTGRPTDL